MDKSELFEMKLHDIKHINNQTVQVLRVHNGWIYTTTKKTFCNGVGDQVQMTSTFVPE